MTGESALGRKEGKEEAGRDVESQRSYRLRGQKMERARFRKGGVSE